MPLAVCATPIGNLEDVTLRVLASCAEADVVLCEDTRHTQVLLDRHGIRGQLAQLPRAQRGAADGRAAAAARGRRADGARLRRRPARSQRPGRPADRRCARGRRAGDRAARRLRPSRRRSSRAGSRASATSSSATCRAARRRSRALWRELARWPHPVVAFESPQRLPATLRSLAAALPDRPVAVCRELTKRFEEVARGTAAELAARFAEPPKGEITLVVGAACRSEAPPTRPARAGRVVELVARRRAPPPGRRRRRPADAAFPVTRCTHSL